MKTEANAEVILHMGRWHLVINGVYMAMEGDVCRDPAFGGAHWTHDALMQAQAYITARLWQSAAQRFTQEQEPPE